jgi:hypothetical protein
MGYADEDPTRDERIGQRIGFVQACTAVAWHSDIVVVGFDKAVAAGFDGELERDGPAGGIGEDERGALVAGGLEVKTSWDGVHSQWVDFDFAFHERKSGGRW